MHRGTNPKVYIETDIDTSLIEDVKVTFKQGDVIFKKRKADCTFEDGLIITQLTEEETLQFKATPKPLQIQARVKLTDGTKIANDALEVKVKDIIDDELFEVV